MKLLFAVVIMAVIALIGTRLTYLNRRLPLGFENILFTGTEYIFIGIILGVMGLNILDHLMLKIMEPFLLFGLSWIGFLFGLQFEVRQLRNLPRFYFSITAIVSLITFGLVSIATYLVLMYFLLLDEPVVLIAAITLGSTASCTAQAALAIVNRNYQIKNRQLLELLRYISSVDGFFALLLFIVALCILPAGKATAFSPLASMQYLSIAFASGSIPALVLISLNRAKLSQQEFLVFLIGAILFCGGLAHVFQQSPLVSGFICGFAAANFCRHRIRALTAVVQAEKSIYIIILLLLGAGWQFRFDAMIIVTMIYLLTRLAGKIAGMSAATRIFKTVFEVPAAFGLGLASEGGLAIAIIISLRLLYPSVADSLLTVVIVSVFINELVAPKLILAQFSDVMPTYLKEKREE